MFSKADLILLVFYGVMPQKSSNSANSGAVIAFRLMTIAAILIYVPGAGLNSPLLAQIMLSN